MDENKVIPRELEISESPDESTGIGINASISEFEQKEDEVIINQMQSASVEEYIYSFKQGGRTITGLTLAGINEAVNRRGNIEVTDIQITEKEDAWLALVTARDNLTNVSKFGAYEQPKIYYNKPDPFAYTKAVHKAQRNAFKQLLPVPVIKKVMDYYLTPQKDRTRQELILEVPVDPRKNSIKLAKDLREKLQRRGLELEDLWDFVKIEYEIESSENMDDAQWTQLEAELIAAKVSTRCFRALVDDINRTKALQSPDGLEIEGESEEEE